MYLFKTGGDRLLYQNRHDWSMATLHSFGWRYIIILIYNRFVVRTITKGWVIQIPNDLLMKRLLIKNMVCDRCKTLLEQEFTKLGIVVVSIKLGEIVYEENADVRDNQIEGILKKNGFELVKDTTDMIIENIKIELIHTINNGETDVTGNMSAYLSKKLNKDYSILSKMFSKKEGVTIEKYYIDLKIERAKELIQMNELNFSEIGYALNYRNSSHLASQFKSVTGMSMGAYKKLQQWDRKPLDKIM